MAIDVTVVSPWKNLVISPVESPLAQVEEVELPVEKVDIIISEWMGCWVLKTSC
jgi:hypothetical protein